MNVVFAYNVGAETVLLTPTVQQGSTILHSCNIQDLPESLHGQEFSTIFFEVIGEIVLK
jgi:hypothetical protein